MYIHTSVHTNVSVFISVAGEKIHMNVTKLNCAGLSLSLWPNFSKSKYCMKFSFMGFCSQISIANIDIHVSKFKLIYNIHIEKS